MVCLLSFVLPPVRYVHHLECARVLACLVSRVPRVRNFVSTGSSGSIGYSVWYVYATGT